MSGTIETEGGGQPCRDGGFLLGRKTRDVGQIVLVVHNLRVEDVPRRFAFLFRFLFLRRKQTFERRLLRRLGHLLFREFSGVRHFPGRSGGGRGRRRRSGVLHCS